MMTMTCSSTSRRYYSSFVVLLLAALVTSHAVVGGSIGDDHAAIARHLQQQAPDVNVNYARAASILDHYMHSDLAPQAVTTTRKKASSVSIAEEPESHNLHSDSIEAERNIERKREGTAKYGKNKKNKGTKGQKKGGNGYAAPSYSPSYNSTAKGSPVSHTPSMAPKQKSVKGEKSKENEKEGDDDDDYDDKKKSSDDVGGDDDDGDNEYRGDTNGTAPVAAPVALPPTSTDVDTTGSGEEPTTSAAPPTDDGASIPHVSRLIPAFRVMYTVTDTGAPENVDYSELAALTRNFLHDTLTGYFTSINDVQYLGTELEFYFIRGVHVVEYQFKTKWGEGGNQVPSIPELNIVVKSVFDSNQQSYLDGMKTALRAENVFSTTTGISMGTHGSSVVVDDGGNDEGSNNVPDQTALKDGDESEGSSTNISKKIIIPVSVIAGAAAILIVFVYFRRRKVSPSGKSVQSEEEEHSLKPDEDITLDTAPMASIQTSVRMMSSSQRRTPELMRQHSKYMESVMDEGLRNQREEEFDEVPIDYLAEV